MDQICDKLSKNNHPNLNPSFSCCENYSQRWRYALRQGSGCAETFQNWNVRFYWPQFSAFLAFEPI